MLPTRPLRRLAPCLTALVWLFTTPAALAQDKHLARNLAATCANCHGSNGHARGAIKPLAGLPAGQILAAVADFRSGALPATVMHQIAKGYTEEQMQLIAGYFAAQPPAGK